MREQEVSLCALLAHEQEGTKERQPPVGRCVHFKTAHLGKCNYTALESTCKIFRLLLLPVNNKGTKVRDILLLDTECAFKRVHLKKCVPVFQESKCKVYLLTN